MKMLYAFRLSMLVICLIASTEVWAQKPRPDASSLSVLAFGNAHYPYDRVFHTIADINYSANAFLNCFKDRSTPCLLQSSDSLILSRSIILRAVQSFVDFVESRTGDTNIGLIYYCGHGIADISGSAFLVPGDISHSLSDTTFEFLASRLLNIDEITHLIIDAQSKSSKKSRYVLIADCCSDQPRSKWYEGITYHFKSPGEGTVNFNDTALINMMDINSSLRASAMAYYDSAGNIVVPPIDSTKPITNEFGFIPELIRTMTFQSSGNTIIYSSALGKETEMVADPDVRQIDFEVGPICRRTLLYFRKGRPWHLNKYLSKLTLPGFDSHTSPALVNRSRGQ